METAPTRRGHFDCIRRVNDAAHTRIGEERHDVLPVAPPALGDRRVSRPSRRPRSPPEPLHAGLASAPRQMALSVGTTVLRSFRDTKSSKWRIRCTMRVRTVAWGKVAPIASLLAKLFASLPSYQHLANLVAFLFRPCNRSFKEIHGNFATEKCCQWYAHHNFRVQWLQKSGVVLCSAAEQHLRRARNDKASRTSVRFFYLASC